MNDDTPITDEELRQRFKSYREVLKGDDASEKFNATADMMRVVSSYLSKNVDGIDIRPITMIMAEFANIAEGGEAEFIKSKEKKPGQPINPIYNLQQASLIAAIEILKKNGFELPDALTYVESRAWLNKKQLIQLRKDYGRGKKWDESRKFVLAQSRIDFVSKQAALTHVDSLLTMSKRSK